MKALVVLLVTGLVHSHPSADPTDAQLVAEIEAAAKESQNLADELALMLASLEADISQKDAVEAAVSGDEDQINDALEEMLEKIEDLALASQDTDSAKLTAIVNKERQEEKELQRTIEELEKVTLEIGGIARDAESEEDVNSIEEMVKLLQDVAETFRNEDDEDIDTDDDIEVITGAFEKKLLNLVAGDENIIGISIDQTELGNNSSQSEFQNLEKIENILRLINTTDELDSSNSLEEDVGNLEDILALINTDQDSNNSTEIEELKTEKVELKKEKVELKKEKVELKKDKVELKKEKVEQNNEKVELKKEKIELKKEKAELKKEKVELKTEKVANSTINSLEEDVKNLEKILALISTDQDSTLIIETKELKKEEVFNNTIKQQNKKKKQKKVESESDEENSEKLRKPKILEVDVEENVNEIVEKIRTPKVLDLDVEELVHTEVVASEEEDNEDQIVEKERKGKEIDSGEDKDCRSTNPSSRVQVCVPSFINRDSTIDIYTKVPKTSQKCFPVTRTVCEETSSIVSKEVCVYSYSPKTHTAPAKVAFVEFESLNENMDVSRCFITKTDGGYSQEECELESQSQTYKLPVISEDLDDLVELTIPEPHKTCQLFKYEVPEITCQEVAETECVDMTFLEPSTTKAHLMEVVQDYNGKCNQENLSMEQKVCTVEKRVKGPAPPLSAGYKEQVSTVYQEQAGYLNHQTGNSQNTRAFTAFNH